MSRRGPLIALALAAVVLIVVGVGYAVSALSGSSHKASSSSAQVALPTAVDSSSGPTAPHSPKAKAVPHFHLMPTYYLGPGPRGPVLHQTSSIAPHTGRLALALDMLEVQPDARAYHSWWQPGWLATATHADGLISVDVTAAPVERPRAMDALTATASLQQVVYTLQAVTDSHDPVQFTRHGKPASAVLGVPATSPVRAGPPALVVSRLNVLEPDPENEGETLGRAPFLVSGTGSTAQGVLTVRVEQHGKVLETRTGHISGSGDPNRLYPWKLMIDIRGFAKGTYEVVATGADPTDPALTVSDQQPLHLGRA
jgi:hypothetical protein